MSKHRLNDVAQSNQTVLIPGYVFDIQSLTDPTFTQLCSSLISFTFIDIRQGKFFFIVFFF